MNTDEYFQKKHKILSEFRGGEEMYNKNALFHYIVDSMIEGVSVQDVILSLISMLDSAKEEIKNMLERKSPISMVIDKEMMDKYLEILSLKCNGDDTTGNRQ